MKVGRLKAIDNQAVASTLDGFLALFDESEFLLDAAAICQAVAQQGLFQLLDIEQALKLNLVARE